MERHELEALRNLIELEGMERRFDYKGYECVIKRAEGMLHLCGYVKIPKNHVLYGDEYDEYGLLDIPAHGGITFNGDLEGDGAFWLGFDCAHSGDLVPMMTLITEQQKLDVGDLISIPQRGFYFREDTYKNMEYVEQNIHDIVDAIEEKLNQKSLN